ncbi:pancreatic elastase precursor, partial [Triplophysa rosa]
MLRFLLLSALAALALAEPRYIEETPEERVVGGEVAQPNAWPWQISLQYLSGGSYYHTCGGTLIRQRWVMTAAHCTENLACCLGDHNINTHEGREQYIAVSQVYIHPNWNRNNLAAGSDMTSLFCVCPLMPSQLIVKLATLPPSGQILPNNNPCYITGWGRTSTGGSLSAVLKQAYLPSVDYQTCSRSDWWGSTVKTTMVCAGGGRNSGCQV